MIRLLTVILSAAFAAGYFILARESESAGAQFATLFGGAPAPVVALALAFPALYLLWEQSEL